MLTNLKKEFCEEGMIFQAFYKFGKIESIKYYFLFMIKIIV